MLSTKDRLYRMLNRLPPERIAKIWNTYQTHISTGNLIYPMSSINKWRRKMASENFGGLVKRSHNDERFDYNDKFFQILRNRSKLADVASFTYICDAPWFSIMNMVDCVLSDRFNLNSPEIAEVVNGSAEDKPAIKEEQTMPEKIKCIYCEQEFDSQNILYDYLQRPICKECLEKTYVKCSRCGKVCSEGLYQKMNNGDVLCEKCFEHHAFVCDDCHGIFYTENDAFIVGDDGGYTVCPSCFQNYNKCDYCGEWHEDVHEVQRKDGAEPECICERCIRNHPHAQSKINVEPDTKELTASESEEEQAPVLLEDLFPLFSKTAPVCVRWPDADSTVGNWCKFAERAPILKCCLSDALLKAKVVSITLDTPTFVVVVEKPNFIS